MRYRAAALTLTIATLAGCSPSVAADARTPQQYLTEIMGKAQAVFDTTGHYPNDLKTIGVTQYASASNTVFVSDIDLTGLCVQLSLPGGERYSLYSTAPDVVETGACDEDRVTN